jgi:2,4-dienoyl-CoA reductase-like NADH-dependent reductase (Old Yellow Enzyme family)
MSEGPLLFRPMALRGLTLQNRIVVAPMHQYCAVDGVVQDWHFQHLLSLSAGGPGLLMAEVSAVEASGRITPACAGLYSDDGERAFARIVQGVKDIGLAKIGVQISHAGRKGSHKEPWNGEGPLAVDDAEAWPTISASAVPFSPGWPPPKMASVDDLERVRRAFVDATLRALRAGFDLVELHAAHGYLIHQFLSPIANLRQDEYGGSLENRMRYPLEVVSAVRQVWPDEKPLGMRVSVSDWDDRGFNIDEAARFIAAAKAKGLDYACVSSGHIVPHSLPPNTPGHHVEFAGRLRTETGIVTRAVGMIVDPRHAEAILAEGHADQVALARAFLDDPRWAWHAADVLGGTAACPPQYRRCRPDVWAGAAMRPREPLQPTPIAS